MKQGSILYGLYGFCGSDLGMIKIYDGAKSKTPRIQLRQPEPQSLSFEEPRGIYFVKSIYIKSVNPPLTAEWKGRLYWNGKRIKSDRYPFINSL